MAAYAQFGYNYPSASQLLTSGSQPTTGQTSLAGPSAQSPSLSPSGGSVTAATAVTSATTTSGGVAQLGALSPGSLSQTSTNHGPPSMVGGGNGTGPGLGSASGTGTVGNGGQSTCCENGRPIMTDPVSGQTVCSCQYDSARLALSAGYAASRLPSSAGVGVYGTPYPSTDQNPYPSIGVDSSAFYSPLSNPYGLKESSGSSGDMSAWTSAGLQPTTGYYPYDPTLAAYGYGAGYDLAARRKNATRESTATLKAWLNEHKKNPYPTKGEKIMLAIITKMTLTQVSTWFANARRRLKKENKMTWEPKNKTDDDDDAMLSDDDKEKDDLDGPHHPGHMDKQRDHKESIHHVKSEQHIKDEDEDDLADDDRGKMDGGMSGHHHLHHHHHMSHHQQSMQQPHPHQAHHLSQQHQQQQQQHQQYQSGLHPYHNPHGHPYSPYGSASSLMYHPGSGGVGSQVKEELSGNSSISKNQTSSDCGVPLPASKPKIWSLADTAACKTPPHPLYPLGMQHEHHHHHVAGHPGHHQHTHQMQEHPDGHHPSHLHQQQQQQQLHQGNPWAGQQDHQQLYQQQQHMDPQQQQHLPVGSGMGSNLAAMQGLADSLSAGGGDGSSPVPNFQEAPHQMASPGNGLMLQYNNTAYGRAPPSGFLGGSRQYSTNSMDSSSYSSPHMSALTGPPQANHPAQTNSMLPHQHPTATTHHSHRTSSNGSSSSHTGTVGMGSFPELQTDTPPQTPPNMKLPSVAGSLLTAVAGSAGTGTCYSRKQVASNGYVNMPSSPSSNGSAGVGFTSGNPLTGGDSDQDSFKTSSSVSSSSSSGSASPFFKSAQVGNVAGFVSPV